MTAFAVGSKNRVFDNRLLINTELYYWRYTDHQLAELSAVNPPPNIGYIGVKLPKSRTYGADSDGSWQIVAGTRLYLSAEYLNGSTGAHTVPTSTGVGNVTAGAPMISSPHWNLTGSLRHEWFIGEGSIAAAGRIHSTKRQLLYAFVNENDFAKPTATADLDLTYSAPKDTWYIRAYVKNVADEAVLLITQLGQSPRDFSGPDPF